MNKIYTTDVLAEKIDISLVELLTGPKSALVFHANFSVNVKDLIKRGRVAYDLPALGLNLGETHPSMKCLDFPGPKGSIDCGKIPSYLIDPWHKILFSRKGSLMQNSDHTSNWFVYQGKQEEALKEFLEEGYFIVPLDYDSEQYEEYSKRLGKAHDEFWKS